MSTGVVSNVIAALALLGSGTAAYIDMSGGLTSTRTELFSVKKEVEKLGNVVTVDREKIIRVEEDVKSLNNNLHALTVAVSSLDDSVRIMNNNLIRLSTKEEMRNGK